MSSVNTQMAQLFLENLFGAKPDGYILVWSLPSKASRWGLAPAALAKGLEKQAKSEVYVGVGLAPKNFGKGKRCPADQIAGIGGVWIDFDIAGPAHKKENLPPTLEALEGLLMEGKLKPSMTVLSGNGLQAYWLFDAVWYFKTADEREAATLLSLKWTRYFQELAKKRGWAVDSVWDLARVMRLPGTFNNKDKDFPKPVLLRDVGGPRYKRQEIELMVKNVRAELPRGSLSSETVYTPTFKLKPDAAPPFDKFQALESLEPKFRATWERKRVDFTDQSPSSYDMSLSTMAAFGDWEDQEIADLLIAFRRKHGDDLKLRTDYYIRTIGKARDAVAKARAEQALFGEKEVPAGTEERPEDAAPPDKKEMLKHISALLGVEIIMVNKYLCQPAQYEIVTPSGKHLIGGVSNLIYQNQLRTVLADACGRIIPKFKSDKWDAISQGLLDAADRLSVGLENTTSGQVREWILTYLTKNSILRDWEEAYKTGCPFEKDGKIYLFLADLRKWLALDSREMTPAKTMGTMLRSFGCKSETLNFKTDKGQTSRYVWSLPDIPEVREFLAGDAEHDKPLAAEVDGKTPF